MAGASKPSTVSPKQQRIAELAKQAAQMSFTSLAYHIDIDWLTEAYEATRKDGALGVDEQTADAYIPKDKKEKRAIGIPTFEDKILQRAVLMLLEPIYEQDFLNCSYGFRPRRSAHDALQTLWEMGMKGGWIVEVDIRVNHDILMGLLAKRITDKRVLKLIRAFLNAGVLENGLVSPIDEGTPQGGPLSPLLSNIVLDVLDRELEKRGTASRGTRTTATFMFAVNVRGNG